MNDVALDLETIRKRLDDACASGAMDLVKVLGTEIEAIQLLSEGWHGLPLVVSEARVGVDQSGTGVQLAGKLAGEGGALAELRVAITPSGADVGCEVLVWLPTPEEWHPESLELGLSVDGFRFSSSPGAFAVTFWAHVGGIADEPIPVTLDVPGPGGSWVARGGLAGVPVTVSGLAKGIGLGSGLEALLPWELDAVGLTDFAFEFTPDEGIRTISVGLATTKSYPLIGDDLVIENVALHVTVHRPFGGDSAQRELDLVLQGITRIGDSVLQVQAVRNGVSGSDAAWTFRGVLTDVDITSLLRALASELGFDAPPLPGVLPVDHCDLGVDEIGVEITPRDGTFRFHTVAHGQFPLVDRGASISLDRAAFEFRREVAKKNGQDEVRYPFDIGLTLSKKCQAVPGLDIHRMALHFAHDEGWTAEGSAVIDLHECENLTLQASYGEDGENSNLRFEVLDIDLPVIRVGAVDASLNMKGLRLDIGSRRAAGDGPSERTFGLEARSHLSVGETIGIDGHLGLSYASGSGEPDATSSVGFEFRISGSTPPIRLPTTRVLLGDSKPTVSLAAAGLKIQKDDQGGWSLTGDTEVVFAGLPPSFPAPSDAVIAGIGLDSERFEIVVRNVASLPAIDLGTLPNADIALGEMQVGLEEISLRVSAGKDFVFGITPALTLPPGINEAVFGKRSDGSVREVLVTDAAVQAYLGMGILGGALGARLQMISSPFKKFQIEQRGDRSYWPLDFGGFGKVAVEVPQLELEGASFHASAGFQEDPDHRLQVPLTGLKHALAEREPSLADRLPDALPLLKKPKLFHDGKVDGPGLVEHLNDIGAPYLPDGRMPELLEDAVLRAADLASGLPARLQWYLEADLPDGFHLDISVDPSGSAAIDISATHEDRPIVLLIPSLPGLVGVVLRRVAFGPILGGSLFQLKLDADFDVFDPVALIGAVAASTSDTLSSWIPDQTESRQTIRIRDFTTFIVYQAGFPIPLPLFYKELSVDYRGPAGFGFRTGLAFDPLGDNSISDVFMTLADLYRFIRYEDARLSTDGDGIKLEASVLETNLQLPAYLGGRTVGPEGSPLAEADFWKMFASAANAVKFSRLDDAVAAIPVSRRTGSVSLTVASLEFEAFWAVTTRAEFESDRGLAWGGADGTPRTLNEFVPWMPDSERGVVFLFAGDATIGDKLTMSGRFGVVTAGRQGMATSVFLLAELEGLFRVQVTGSFGFDFSATLGEGAGGFEGMGRLDLLGHEFVSVEATLSDRQIYFHQRLDARLPGLDMLSFTDDVEVRVDGSRFLAEAKVQMDLFGVAAQGSMTLDHEALRVNTSGSVPNVANMSVDLSAGKGGEVTVSGALALHADVRARALDQARKRLQGRMDDAIRQLRAARAADAKKWFYQRRFPGLQGWNILIALAESLKASLQAVGFAERWIGILLDEFVPDVAEALRLAMDNQPLFRGFDIEYSASLALAREARARTVVNVVFANTPVTWKGELSLHSDQIANNMVSALLRAAAL